MTPFVHLKTFLLLFLFYMVFRLIYFIVRLHYLQFHPCYATYKAIKSNQEQQFRSLLIFWVSCLSFLAIESFTDLFLSWLPLYVHLKLIFVVWLILPQTQGSNVFYYQSIQPFFDQHGHTIDNIQHTSTSIAASLLSKTNHPVQKEQESFLSSVWSKVPQSDKWTSFIPSWVWNDKDNDKRQ
ncbi:unnamed protein product [Rhizopus microsporus]